MMQLAYTLLLAGLGAVVVLILWRHLEYLWHQTALQRCGAAALWHHRCRTVALLPLLHYMLHVAMCHCWTTLAMRHRSALRRCHSLAGLGTLAVDPAAGQGIRRTCWQWSRLMACCAAGMSCASCTSGQCNDKPCWRHVLPAELNARQLAMHAWPAASHA
jgi:hypothetical protein